MKENRALATAAYKKEMMSGGELGARLGAGGAVGSAFLLLLWPTRLWASGSSARLCLLLLFYDVEERRRRLRKPGLISLVVSFPQLL